MMHHEQSGGGTRRNPEEMWIAEGPLDFAYDSQFSRNGRMLKIGFGMEAASVEIFASEVCSWLVLIPRPWRP